MCAYSIACATFMHVSQCPPTPCFLRNRVSHSAPKSRYPSQRIRPPASCVTLFGNLPTVRDSVTPHKPFLSRIGPSPCFVCLAKGAHLRRSQPSRLSPDRRTRYHRHHAARLSACERTRRDQRRRPLRHFDFQSRRPQPTRHVRPQARRAGQTPEEMSENVSQAFLSLSIGCAKYLARQSLFRPRHHQPHLGECWTRYFDAAFNSAASLAGLDVRRSSVSWTSPMPK